MKLPRDHPAQMALEEALCLRSVERDHLARFYLNRRVFRCRRTVKALVGIANAHSQQPKGVQAKEDDPESDQRP